MHHCIQQRSCVYNRTLILSHSPFGNPRTELLELRKSDFNKLASVYPDFKKSMTQLVTVFYKCYAHV